MDECKEYEIPYLVDKLLITQKNEWDRTRQMMLCSLKPYLKKKNLTPQELYPLPFDDNHNSSKSEIKVTNDDITALRKLMIENNKRSD